MLSTFHDLFGNDPAGEPLAKRVAEGLAGQQLELLQHAGARLGHHRPRQVGARASARKGTAAGTLTADGAAIEPRKTKHEDERQDVVAAARERVQVAHARHARSRPTGMWLVISERGRARRAATTRSAATGSSVARTYRDARRRRDRSRGRQASSSATSCSSRSRSTNTTRRGDPEHRARRSAARRLRDREPAARPRLQGRLGQGRRAVGASTSEHARRSPRGVRLAAARRRRRRSSTRCAR